MADYLSWVADRPELLGVIVTSALAFLGFWWRATRLIHLSLSVIDDLKVQSARLSDANLQLTKSFVHLSTKVEERDKDISKLHGMLDLTRQTMVDQIKIAAEINGSLNALWLTMQKLYPEQVPRRLSDRV